VRELVGVDDRAVRHEAPHPDRLPGRQQVVRPLGSQAVGRREIAIEVSRADRTDRGQLMDDRLWLRPAHRLRDLIVIKRVRDHRHSAQLVEQRLLGLAARVPWTS
jgi:hypothetical protein